MVATLDGIVEGLNALFEAKFIPAPLFEETIAERCIAELQRKMWVDQVRGCLLSIITGNGAWMESPRPRRSALPDVLVAAEKRVWRCVQSGDAPQLMLDPPARETR
jgi:hypothetical protein